jgi:transposase-like protein
MDCRIAMLKSCWLSAECRSTTSASSAGCSASHRCFAEAARACRHRVGDHWWVDETYVKVSGRWRYVYRAIDQFGQVIDVYVATRRDSAAARYFFTRALATTKVIPVEVTTDKARSTRMFSRRWPRLLGTVRRPTPIIGWKRTTGSSSGAYDRCAV